MTEESLEHTEAEGVETEELDEAQSSEDEAHDGESGDDGQPEAPAIDHEAMARMRGWKPRDEWKGRIPDSFIDDPAAYNDRYERDGDPRIVAENRRLAAEIEKQAREMDFIRKFVETQRASEQARIDDAIRQAVESGDVEGHSRLLKQRDEINRPEEPPQPEQPKSDPAFEAWAPENSWYNTDEAMTVYANNVAARKAMAEGYHPNQGRAFYDQVTSLVRAEFPHKFDTGKAVAAASGEGAKRTTAPKQKSGTWASLPKGVRDDASVLFRRGMIPDTPAGREEYAKSYYAEYGE